MPDGNNGNDGNNDDARALAYQTLGSANPFPALEPEQIGYLELLSSPDPRIAPTVFPLAHTRVRLGRFSPAGTYATTSDFFVAVCDEATAISPMNTMFEYIGGEFHAFDTRSAHGTYVNGEQIFKRRKLAYGDVIELGGIADAAGERHGGARVRFLGTTPPSGRAIRGGPAATKHTWKSARGHLVVELDLVSGNATAKVAIEYDDWCAAALATAQRVTAVRSPYVAASEVDRDAPNTVRYRAGEALTALPAGVVELREAFLITADVCDAAAACHLTAPKPTLLGPFDRGLVWRRPSRDAVVFAAGLAREVDAFERGLTGRAMLARHVRMSPEEVMGRPRTPATDVFFAAYFLIELVTGREPYPTSDTMTYLAAVSSGAAQLPPSMPQTIARAFSPDPTARPSLAAFVATLRA